MVVILDKKVLHIAQIILAGISFMFLVLTCSGLNLWVLNVGKIFPGLSFTKYFAIGPVIFDSVPLLFTFFLIVWKNLFSSITLILFKFSTLSSALIFVWFIELVKNVFVLISSNF